MVLARPDAERGKDAPYEIIKERSAADYIPVGMELTIDGRLMKIDSVDYNAGTVSLQDMELRGWFPIFRSESIPFVRQFVEEREQQTFDLTPDVPPAPAEPKPVPEPMEIDGGQITETPAQKQARRRAPEDRTLCRLVLRRGEQFFQFGVFLCPLGVINQKADITVDGFERTDHPDDFFDLAVGNVPFGSYQVHDKRYDRQNLMIHDYFITKTLDKVRPGGIVAFITTKGTMDKKNSKVREALAQKADLLGAVRLPSNAFKANAGTEVTTDILFFQKRDRIPEKLPEWVEAGQTEDGIPLKAVYCNIRLLV